MNFLSVVVIAGLAVFSLSIPAFASQPKRCPKDYFRFDNDCVKFYSTPQDWQTSDKQCVKDGGHLMSIHTGFENSYAHTFFYGYNGTLDQMWIGLSRKQNESKFTWTDKIPLLYTAWDKGQPTNDSDCVSQSKDNKLWIVKNCTLKLPSICRLHLDGPPTVPPPPVHGNCPSTEWIKYGTKCYFVSEKPSPWINAVLTCRAIRTDLVSIHSDQDQSDLITVLKDKTMEYWIGLIFGPSIGWYWTDSTPVNFYNWTTPPHVSNNDTQPTFIYVTGPNETWTPEYNETFGDKRGYVCMTNQVADTTPTAPPTSIVTSSTTAKLSTTTHHGGAEAFIQNKTAILFGSVLVWLSMLLL